MGYLVKNWVKFGQKISGNIEVDGKSAILGGINAQNRLVSNVDVSMPNKKNQTFELVSR